MKRSIYIFTNGQLQRKDNTIYFENETGKKYLPVENIREMYLFGEVSFNKKFLEFCSQKEILLHFFNHHGYYVGTYYPREHYNAGYVIFKQVEHYIDMEKRVHLARQFVYGAVRNILQVLRYYQNRGKDVGAFREHIEEILPGIDQVNQVSQLMALEGNIREVYYHAFDRILENEMFRFEKRTKRPPQNHLNTLLSFGNSLLYTMVLSEIYKTHLDPRIGYLHTTNFRRFSLNLDVAEIFKPILVDRVIFTLIGKRMLTAKHFEKQLEGTYLKETGRKVFVEELEKRLQTTIRHRSIGREVSYRRLLRLELYKIEKQIVENQEYQPFVAQW